MSKVQTTHWYVASPMQTYYTALYARMREVLPESLANTIHGPFELHYAEGMYPNAKAWLREWPVLLRTQINGGTIFFTDASGYIGRGVWIEVADTLREKLPVYCATHDGKLLQVKTLAVRSKGLVKFSAPNERDWKQHVKVTVCESAPVAQRAAVQSTTDSVSPRRPVRRRA
jgi:hypothetical protein